MILGITGGIGTGKSTVLNILQEKYGFHIFESDKIAKELMNVGKAAYNEIVSCFGTEILKADQTIDNQKMASVVFQDKDRLEQLNAIVHPAVIEEMKYQIEICKEHGETRFVIESALLIESGCDSICDTVWYIYADEEVRIKRLMEHRHMTREKILAVMKNQLQEDAFQRKADAVIDNSKSFDDTLVQIEKLLVF